MYSFIAVTLVYLLAFSTSAYAGSAQFYDASTKTGLAVSTAQNGDLLFQMTAPQSAGWGAVAVGDKMDGALMFVMYPSSTANSVTVSARSAQGHDPPAPFSGIHLNVESSNTENSMMTANVICHNCTAVPGIASLDLTSTKQAWIWANGPGKPISSTANDASIEQHSVYGTFFMDMTTTKSDDSTTVPTIAGTSDTNVKALPGSVSALVVVHAICLGGSFLLLFPFGVILLRWFGSFRFHWMFQVFALVASVFGLIIAIAFSAMDPLYSSFSEGHQVIGIIVVIALIAQAALGYSHHRSYQKIGQQTWVSHSHIWVGRVVIVVGMINAVLGFVLNGSTGAAAGIAILDVIILAITAAAVWIGGKRRRSTFAPGPPDSSNISLNSYDRPPGETNGYRNDFGYDQRMEYDQRAQGRGFV